MPISSVNAILFMQRKEQTSSQNGEKIWVNPYWRDGDCFQDWVSSGLHSFFFLEYGVTEVNVLQDLSGPMLSFWKSLFLLFVLVNTLME